MSPIALLFVALIVVLALFAIGLGYVTLYNNERGDNPDQF